MPLAEVMATLEAAGSEQTRKTYARHGAPSPMYGVSFATLKTLVKRIGVDQELALQLWATGNYDARVLALKVADPAQVSREQLDAWAGIQLGRGSTGYVSMLAAEGPHASASASAWLVASTEGHRRAGWLLVTSMAMRDEAREDGWFEERAREIEATVHSAPSTEREGMMAALTAIGCRSEALRAVATAAAGRIGPVDIDVGDTACKQPNVAESLHKAWEHSLAKGYPSPAAHERTRENLRTRC